MEEAGGAGGLFDIIHSETDSEFKVNRRTDSQSERDAKASLHVYCTI